MYSEAQLLELERKDPQRAALERAIQDAGSTKALAAKISRMKGAEPLTGAAVRLWRTVGVPPDRVAQVAAATDNRVKARRLRRKAAA